MAFSWKPYGPKASLNLRIDAAETGSLPLRMHLTLDRSSGGSPSFGMPRAAACSNAKLGATEMTPPVSSGLADISRIQRPRSSEHHVVADHRRQHRGDQAHVME